TENKLPNVLGTPRTETQRPELYLQESRIYFWSQNFSGEVFECVLVLGVSGVCLAMCEKLYEYKRSEGDEG
ncbi:MAG: hypothetical protein AAFW73_26905, partial [Bacteroidota bacterium]